MDAPDKIKKLVDTFSNNVVNYKNSNYNETQVRQEFINPFFKQLGWDIDNEQGFAEAYKDVIHEDAVKVGGLTKAPDYSFRIGGQRKFFLEAKKPSVSIKDDIHPAYQLRRYAWSGKLPVSILTDFEEFAVYDCTTKPNPNDKASTSRILYYTYKDYIEKWNDINSVFSKEAVLKGSFDRFAVSSKGKKGTSGVDAEFLKSLDSWRDLLARNIVNRNQSIDEDELNYSLQKIIDRIIFLRICEDRGVELEGQLLNTIGNNIYDKLKYLFHIADQKYNSGLFDYKKDKITDTLSIDDKVLKIIIEEMYYPKSPYEFSVIPVEILGHSYEQYLGKVLRITPGHRIKIEEKPEVRKAGGVYYTPQYIVDYIVKNTVGRLLEGKTADEIGKIKICDPACGSGSFLLGAYQCLLDWHREYYKNANIKKKDAFLTPDGNLTTAIKRKILLNNIYGVDIDTNAVEVTKLSLMLKAMEGETEASISNQIALLHERVLPTLDNNIKSGNSLIDIDFYDNQLDFEPGVEKKIKPFNWESAFPEVFNSRNYDSNDLYDGHAQNKNQKNHTNHKNHSSDSGFDVVIGNPPYLNLTKNSVDNNILDYYNLKYKSLSGGSSKNLFQLFIEKILKLNPKIFSFIVPEALLSTSSNNLIRKMMIDQYNLDSLVVFDNFVFQDATIGTTIFVLNNNDNKNYTSIYKLFPNNNIIRTKNLMKNDILDVWDVSSINENSSLLQKIRYNKILMNDLVKMSKGMVVENRKEHLRNEPLNNDVPFLLGNSIINKYSYKIKYFTNYNELNIIGGTRNIEKHQSIPRLLIRRTGSNLCVVYSDNYELIESTLYILTSKVINLKYLLSLLNSKLLTFYLKNKLITNKQGFPQVLMWQLGQLPIKTIDFTNKDEKAQHDKMIELVETMLQLNKDLHNAKLPEQKEQLKARIDYTDKKIDKLVYDLYGLTEEEIRIVEGEG